MFARTYDDNEVNCDNDRWITGVLLSEKSTGNFGNDSNEALEFGILVASMKNLYDWAQSVWKY